MPEAFLSSNQQCQSH